MLRVTLRTTLTGFGSGWFSGPLEGWDKPALEVFLNKNASDGPYLAWWEIEEHIDGSRSHVLYASGRLRMTDDGYSGEIVSMRGGKPKGWLAVARKGSAVVEFAPI